MLRPTICLLSHAGFNMDSVLFELQRAKFPTEKWKSLANGLRLASAVSITKETLSASYKT